MTRIKICCITNSDDALAACAYGADVLGFIAVPESPRYLTVEKQRAITQVLPPFVQKVVVVRNVSDAADYDSNFVQFYNDQQSVVGVSNGIRCFRIKDARSLDEIRTYDAHVVAYLLDAYHHDKLGGSGESFNWDLAVEAKKLTDKPIILAGGLTPDNIQDALNAVRPYAVDVCSSVEASPGIKDHDKLRKFIQAVREWDLKHGI